MWWELLWLKSSANFFWSDTKRQRMLNLMVPTFSFFSLFFVFIFLFFLLEEWDGTKGSLAWIHCSFSFPLLLVYCFFLIWYVVYMEFEWWSEWFIDCLFGFLSWFSSFFQIKLEVSIMYKIFLLKVIMMNLIIKKKLVIMNLLQNIFPIQYKKRQFLEVLIKCI